MVDKEKEVIITQAQYIASAVKKEQYPEKKMPEFVFIGRSNVGKSSLINSLTRDKGRARVSAPINFYELGVKLPGEEERRACYLVDLPGYGYAKTGRERRATWSKFIEEYLLTSPQLQFVCQLIDCRHDPMPADVKMFHWLVEQHIPVLIVATKADKLGKNAVQKQVVRIRQVLGVPELSVLPYSSLKNEGRSDLLDVIGQTLLQ